jgi:hypothetical protein
MKIEGDNSCGVASVILGILSICFILLTFLALLAPLAGLGLSITSLLFARAQKKHGANKWSKAGFILSMLGIILNGLLIFWMLSAILRSYSQYKALCDAAGGCDKILEYLQAQQATAGAIA